MFVEIHRVTDNPPFHMGGVLIEGETPDVDPDEVVSQWWCEYQATEPACDNLFVEWLIETGRASDESWDGDPNSSPHHVYL